MTRCTARDPYADSRGYGDRCVLESDTHVEHVDAFGEAFNLEPSDSRVHDHSPEEGRGLGCPERTLPSGRLRGACLPDPVSGVSRTVGSEGA